MKGEEEHVRGETILEKYGKWLENHGTADPLNTRGYRSIKFFRRSVTVRKNGIKDGLQRRGCESVSQTTSWIGLCAQREVSSPTGYLA